jgi:N-acetylmuramoyl-L-alanine amidase
MKYISRKIFIGIFLSILLFTFAGEVRPYSLYGPIKALEVPSYKLRRTTYLPLISICQTHGLSWEWDPIGKVAVLKKDNSEARLKIGSYRMYVNGKIQNLEKPPLFYKGIVVVPVSFAKKTIKKIFEKEVGYIPRYVSPTKRRYTIDTIAIDPGHGGKDPGAVGVYGLKEKDIVLDISKKLKKELEAAGIKVYLTRDRDVFIPLGKRAALANNVEADFFISVHANAFRSRRVKGFEIYYLSEATDDNARALAASENAVLKYEDVCFVTHTKNLDATIWDLELTENRTEAIELAKSICSSVSRRLAVKNRGVKAARFYVLKGAHMPSVLLEVGFISNTKDAKSLKSPYYRNKLAQALAGGILSYKREYEKTNGFTE